MCSGYRMDQQMLGRAMDTISFLIGLVEHHFLLLLLFVFLSALVGVKVQLGLSPRGNLVARVKDIDTL